MRRFLVLLTMAVVAVSLAYAVAPPRSAPAYADRASSTLQMWRSQTQTARLWIGAVEAGRATRTAARVAFVESEEDARREAAGFAGYTPPDPLTRTVPVRDQVTSAGDRVVGLLGQVRVAAETDQWQRLPALADRLDRLQQQLAQLASGVVR